MAEVDFSDFDSAEVWFEGQSIETRCAITSRVALRVCANICAIEGEARNTPALAILRAILTSAGRGSGRRTDVNWDAASAASSAAYSASSAAHSTTDAAAAAAAATYSTSYSASSAAASAAHSATHSTTYSAAAASAAHSAASWDAAQPASTLYSNKVWAGAEVPAAITDNHSIFLAFLRSDPAWAFWLQFYEAMWDGTFTNWDLAFEVIQIDEADWEKGYAHIGEVIAGIEARLNGEPLDQEALKSHLNQVIDFPSIHRDFAAGMGHQFVTAVATYKSAAPSNTLPDGFQQFEMLPAAFASISEVLGSDFNKDDKIAALQAEVNQLHTIIMQLRLDLSDARALIAGGRLDALEVAKMRTFGEKTQTFLTNIVIVGGIGMAALNFFGVNEDQLKYDTLKAQLDDLAEQMQSVEVTPDSDEAP